MSEKPRQCKKVFPLMNYKLPRTVPFQYLAISTQTYTTQFQFIATVSHITRTTTQHFNTWPGFSHSRNLDCCIRMITHFRLSHSLTKKHSTQVRGLRSIAINSVITTAQHSVTEYVNHSSLATLFFHTLKFSCCTGMNTSFTPPRPREKYRKNTSSAGNFDFL